MPEPLPELHCGRFALPLSRPLVMGVINVTDDSFSGDGLGADAGRAAQAGLQLIDEGADILDIGAESSRPGAAAIGADAELSRLIPVIERLAACAMPISVDTNKPEVMRAAIAAGASMVNDIRALRAPGALACVAASSVAVVLMHMQGEPQTMQLAPEYGDVLAEVTQFLAERAAAAENAGIARNRIVLDPGFGFGKTQAHNLELFKGLGSLRGLGLPLLVGVSRKSMLGRITGRPVEQRAGASVAAAVLAAGRGAAILRVHDVAATVDALRVWQAVDGEVIRQTR